MNCLLKIVLVVIVLFLQFPFPAPVEDDPSNAIRSLVHLRKESLKIIK